MYLKTTFESTEYNAVNGYEKDNQKIVLIEDANGDYFVNVGVLNIIAFAEILPHLMNMELVSEIEFKPSEL